MPGIVHVKVVKARDLPVMDKRSELTDAFVEIKLGSGWNKTEVCPKTLHPEWNSNWFKFAVTDEELQDEPLQLKVMDRDIYSAHDTIGRVYIILNPLVELGSTHSTIEGWFPIFDTLHGVRGEVYVQVKLEVIQDQHRFKQSSFGVQFFSCPCAPEGLAIQNIHGFVEELVVNDDPEYQWIDRLRTPRASNEARQRLFTKLSGELRRKLGLRALEVEGNAILGYKQLFDVEGDSGIVVRGIGTCVSLVPKHSSGHIPVWFPSSMEGVRSSGVQADRHPDEPTLLFDPVAPLVSSPQHALGGKTSPPNSDGSPAKSSAKHPPDSLLGTSSGSGGPHPSTTPPGPPKTIASTSEYPFYTITSLPPGVLRHIGGIVSARSVKLLDKINNPDDPETRDAWWKELRSEVRSHVRAMGCSAVIGYSEYTSICDTLCVFSATGTAVSITEPHRRPPISPGSVGDVRSEGEGGGSAVGGGGGGGGGGGTSQSESPVRSVTSPCMAAHLPYSTSKLPFDVKPSQCKICRVRQVPSILLSTSAIPAGLTVRGRGCLVQTRVCSMKRKMKGEENAFHISKELPFLEYKLHSQLLNKMYVRGMNAVFGLRIQVTVGDTMIIGIATGTAVYLEALPSPPKLTLKRKESAANLSEVQSAVNRALENNRKKYGLEQPLEMMLASSGLGDAQLAVEEELQSELDLTTGKKDVFLVDIDGEEVLESNVLDRPLPEGFDIGTLSTVPGLPSEHKEMKMLTMVMKMVLDESRLDLEKQFSQFFDKIIQVVAFKVRGYYPCLLSGVRFDVDLPEENEVQVAVTAMVARTEPGRTTNNARKQQSDEFIFPMEEIPGVASHNRPVPIANTPSTATGKFVMMSSNSFITTHHVERYLGVVNLFLIRESTSIRESGGLGAFMDVFLLEANAIARAHVKAMGGNALTTYRLNKCVLIDHPHKNQAQCLLNVSGDAVRLTSLSSAGGQNPPTYSHL